MLQMWRRPKRFQCRRDSVCGIENVLYYFGGEQSSSCPTLKSLPVAKVNRLRLIAFTKEISELSIIDFALWLSLGKHVLNNHSKLRKKYKI